MPLQTAKAVVATQGFISVGRVQAWLNGLRPTRAADLRVACGLGWAPGAEESLEARTEPHPKTAAGVVVKAVAVGYRGFYAF